MSEFFLEFLEILSCINIVRMERIQALSLHYLGYDLCLSPSLKINKCNNVPDITIIKLITK